MIDVVDARLSASTVMAGLNIMVAGRAGAGKDDVRRPGHARSPGRAIRQARREAANRCTRNERHKWVMRLSRGRATARGAPNGRRREITSPNSFPCSLRMGVLNGSCRRVDFARDRALLRR